MNIQEAKKLYNTINETDEFISPSDYVDFTNHSYNMKLTSGGSYHELKTYDEPLTFPSKENNQAQNTTEKKKYSRKHKQKSTVSSPDISLNNSNSNNSSKLKQISNSRRKQKLRWYMRTNIDHFTHFITLSFGYKDYQSFIESTDSYDYFFNKKELISLKGVHSIKNISNNQLKTKVINYLDDHFQFEEKIKENVHKDFPELGKYTKYQKVKRELNRRFDSYVSNCDPFNYEETEKEVKRFLKRLRYKIDNIYNVFKLFYLGVPGPNQDNRLHYHLFLSLPDPLADETKIQSLWRNGITDLKPITSQEGILEYPGKNITEMTEIDELQETIKNKQLYFFSDNLQKPIITKIDYLNEFFLSQLEEYFPTFIKYYESNNSYGTSYQLKLYETETDEIFQAINEMTKTFIQDLISIAEERNKKEIDQEIFEAVLDIYMEEAIAS